MMWTGTYVCTKQYKILLFLILIAPSWTFAQNPIVTSRIDFADMKLILTQAARKEIQTEVDALLRSPRYFNLMLARVDFYFPVIQKVLKEEGLPDDFKYLVIQESGLVSDAISTSRAVGFWQFKRASAQEVGLRVDDYVDERKNIVSSTRGAAKYIIRNNFYFNNWVYAMLSYYHGRSGAEKIVDKKYYGASKMEIDKSTHWYFKKYLAHKIAFESAIGKRPYPQLVLVPYREGVYKTLSQIAKDFLVDEEELKRYNKWLAKGEVPDDKVYNVIIPAEVDKNEDLLTLNDDFVFFNREVRRVEQADIHPFPVIKQGKTKTKINGIPGIIAKENDDIEQIAQKAGISEKKFRRLNDLSKVDKVITDQVYYFKAKRNKAKIQYHTVQQGETIWSIAQLYGIKLKKLMQMNRLTKMDYLKPGRVLWLRYTRPPHVPVEYKPVYKTRKPDTLVTPLPDQQKDTISDILNITTKNTFLSDTLNDVNSDTTVEKNAVLDVKYELADAASKDVTDSLTIKYDLVYSEKFHTVKQGDTLYSISKHYHVALEDLMQWNNKNNYHIAIGEKLTIKTDLK